ncbi:MAG: HlyD family secretion protein [Chthoniobacteraceae bacterium]
MSNSTTIQREDMSSEATVSTSFVQDASADAPKPLFQRPGFIFLLGIVFVVLAVTAAHFFLNTMENESTDDAFVEGHVINVAPKVSGRVQSVEVKDNQFVRKGDPLFEIDPADYDVVLEQKQAALAQAEAKLANEQSALKQAQAHIDTVTLFGLSAVATMKSSEATATKNAQDFARNQSLATRGVISQQDLQHSTTDVDTSKADLESKQKQMQAAYAYLKEAQLDSDAHGTQVKAAQADVKAAQAQLQQAQLQVSYAQVTAPQDGRVTRKSVEAGDYVQTGQATMAIVPREVWVTANFKETQLTHMGPGQPVELEVDAYPGHPFKGHVDSIQAGSGAAFSLLPPENATGNFVKVVQRVPVKIVLDEDPRDNEVLGPGMSVVPTVTVRHIVGRFLILLIVAVAAAFVALIFGRKLLAPAQAS